MTVVRGQVVLVDFPFSGGFGSKLRPAVVVQNDRDNGRLTNTIVATISSQVHRASGATTRVLVDVSTPEGQQTGLRVDSAVNCINLFTLEQVKVLHVLGTFSARLMALVDDALKATLALP